MKKIAIILIVACAVSIGAQEKCDFSTLNFDLSRDDIVLYNGKSANGVFCEFHENGKLFMTIDLKNGYMEGISKVYTDAGILKEEISFKNSKLDGALKKYNENGNLISEVIYKNGEPTKNKRYYFYSNGILESEVIFGNEKETLVKRYYKSGRLSSETTYTDGSSESTESRYTETGKLWGKIIYKHDGTANKAISGTCGNGRVLTSAEVTNWNNGHTVNCGY